MVQMTDIPDLTIRRAEQQRRIRMMMNAMQAEERANLKGGEESREMARRCNGGDARDPTPPLLLAARQGDHELFEAVYTGILLNASDAGQLEEATSQLEEFLGMVLGTIEPSSVVSQWSWLELKKIVCFLERQPFQLLQDSYSLGTLRSIASAIRTVS